MRFAVLSILLALSVASSGCADKSADAGSGGADEAMAGSLQGVVVDDAIRPVAGARVDLDNAFNATTDADGLFRFDGVAPGAHVVRATKNGFADAVTQVIVAASEPTPLVKLVLLLDASSLAFAETFAIEGFVECGTYHAGYSFAACGTGNVGSVIVCSSTDGAVCMGNVSSDRYITIHWFDRTPDFLAVEVAWQATQALGDSLRILLGSATPEQLEMVGANTHNQSIGPSPLFVTINKTELAESGIGRDAYFLSQTFATGTVNPCGQNVCGVGAVAQQRFTMYLTSFYGYQPPSDWRFSATGVAPPPPTVS